MVLGREGPIGVVLAGGRGRRMGGDKAAIALAGRPLAQWAVDALAAVVDDVVVACRLDAELPGLRGVREAWVESARAPRGPAAGLLAALHEAQGRAVVVCALGLPLVRPQTVRAIAQAPRGAPAVVAEAGTRLEARVGRWEPAAIPLLERLPPDASLDVCAHAAHAGRVPVPDGEEFLHVDAPEDLLHAAALLDARRARARTGAR